MQISCLGANYGKLDVEKFILQSTIVCQNHYFSTLKIQFPKLPNALLDNHFVLHSDSCAEIFLEKKTF